MAAWVQHKLSAVFLPAIHTRHYLDIYHIHGRDAISIIAPSNTIIKVRARAYGRVYVPAQDGDWVFIVIVQSCRLQPGGDGEELHCQLVLCPPLHCVIIAFVINEKY